MSRVFGAALSGVDGVAVEVEVRLSSQLPRVDVVGLPEAAVRESSARVRAAIAAAGFKFPQGRVTVNLAPAELRKSGAGLDLPIAIGVLAAAGVVPAEALDGLALLGELALDGRVRPVRGALSLCIAARAAGCNRFIAPAEGAGEAALAPGVCVFAAADLGAVVAHLVRSGGLPAARPPAIETDSEPLDDLRDVRGQERAKRALEIAAAGGHAVLLVGPPGCGKTLLARRLPGLLPPLAFDELLETTRIHGAAGLLSAREPLLAARPFRAPHHSASRAGLLGGGSPPRPGEVSLAHRGVLFLDELPEFPRAVLDSLRQVLEGGEVVVARARGTCVFPARFQLIAAANPCMCGWRGSQMRDCRCDDGAVERYAARVSGPFRDRIDLHVTVPGVPWTDLAAPATGESTAAVRARVEAARERQSTRARATYLNAPALNAHCPDRLLDEVIAITPDAQSLLGRAADRFALSARGVRRVLRVARTIADLSGDERLGSTAVAEAIGFRT